MGAPQSHELHLLAERTALQRMIAQTPEGDVLDRGSLVARLETVEQLLSDTGDLVALTEPPINPK